MLKFNPTITKTFCIVLILSLSNLSKTFGQYISDGSSYSVKIDSVTRQPDQPIPFDQPFTIILNLQNPRTVAKVLLLPIVRTKDGIGYSYPDRPDFIKPRVSGSQLIIDCPPLVPNYTFDLYLYRNLDSSNLNTFLNLVSKAVDAKINPRSYTSAQLADINKKYADFRETLSKTSLYPTRIHNAHLAVIKYDYLFSAYCVSQLGVGNCTNRCIDDYLTAKPNVASAITDINSIQPAIIAYPAPAGINFLMDLQYVSHSFKLDKLNDQVINSLINIWIANESGDFFNGLISTDYTDKVTLPSSKVEILAKQKNFQNNLQNIINLRDTIQKLQNEDAALTNDPAFVRVNNYLFDMIQKFVSAKKTIDDNVKVVANELSNNLDFAYTEFYVNNTDGFKSLQAKSSSIFSPQIGLSFLYMSKNDGGNQLIPKLTLGVNFNFRSVNKNIPRRDIPNKNLGNYISGFVGITFGGFNDSQYSNLLTSNSLLVGLNYRVTSIFYFSMGTSIFRQLDKNPVINAYHTQCGVYASLLLDLDFTSAASNIISYVTK